MKKNNGGRISVLGQNEAKVDVNASADSVRIRTEYPERNQSFSDGESRRHNNPATVEYSLTIPRKARIDSADLVNGSLDIEGVEGDVKAACVNGHIKARGLTGDVKLSTVNGGVEATITRLEESKSTSLNSVNGSIVLTIPSDSNAQVKANTIHGAITNDFGLQVNDGEYVGHDLSGQIGNGGPRLFFIKGESPILNNRGPVERKQRVFSFFCTPLFRRGIGLAPTPNPSKNLWCLAAPTYRLNT